MAKLSTKEMIESLKEMSILEVKDLVDAMKEEFGVDPSAVAAAPAAATDDAPTEVSVFLTSPGGSKIAVIKEVRTITGLGLKEAKALVDSAPTPIKEGIKPEEANEIKEKLEAAGAEAEVK